MFLEYLQLWRTESATYLTGNSLSWAIRRFMGTTQVHLARKLLPPNDCKGENKTVQNTSDPYKQEWLQIVVTITLTARKPPVPASQGSTTLNKAVNGC